ncbi:Protein cereblon [Pseudolycoriella hygida]|uniref:Protein cereblon n=1 Tax=Pseudolycoriella hygida TaxID=35572 RepID=A0A9Q0MYR3_9DIPT|nr:Protein cereblon [Pseudolycoriella hygida]
MFFHNIKLALLSCLCISLIGSERQESSQRSLQTDENIFFQICKIRFCFDRERDCSFQKCMESLMPIDKYGECPIKNGTTYAGRECMDSCHGHDYRCQGIQKCCTFNCGAKCTNPLRLETISDRTLPPIPQNITLTNLERHRNIAEISWQMFYTELPVYNLVFVLEGRSHFGYYYDEQKLSNWFSMAFEVTSSIQKYQKHKGGIVKNEFGANVRLRPGRWYQFRLSAVNGNGTRGYSTPSPNFQLKERPKNPLPPRNFSIEVRPKLLRNNTVYTKAVWKPPRTSYPIEKYRIAWSLYLDSNNGSLWQNEAFVHEPTRQFEFWNLNPNSVYYLQIQALSSFGKKRSLKSPKEWLLLNTSISTNVSVGNLQSTDTTSSQNMKANVTLKFLKNKRFNLVVRIGFPAQLIGSFIELCSGEADCLTKPSTKDLKLIRTKKGHFDFVDLIFSTKYSFRIRKSGRVLYDHKMDSDSDNQSDSTEEMERRDSTDGTDDVDEIPESADILIHLNEIPDLIPSRRLESITYEPERAYEVGGENSEHFDRDLPPEHLYLGNLERVSATDSLKPGKYYHRVPIFSHHRLVFPGEQIPMILSQSVFHTTNFLTDSNEGCLFGLMFLRLKGVPKHRTYGVTCQIYEKGPDDYGNIVFKSKACQRFVIYHKLKENEMFSLYDTMNPQRCTATIEILPEIVLGDPLLGHSSNNVKKFFRNKSMSKKVRRFEAGSVAWPLFIYDQYSITDISERAKSFLTNIKVDSMPSDPVALSFWLCKNILPNEKDRLSIFMSNSVTDRMQIIGKSMNMVRFFICKHCNNRLANINMSFAMSKQGVQSSYCNPSGFIHETNTVYSTLHNAVYVTGRPSIEFSWFPGYSWQITLCSSCHHHLGWKFIAIKESVIPKSFFGLSGSCVLIEKDEDVEHKFFLSSFMSRLSYGHHGMGSQILDGGGNDLSDELLGDDSDIDSDDEFN